jgi:hypothetical protein
MTKQYYTTVEDVWKYVRDKKNFNLTLIYWEN